MSYVLVHYKDNYADEFDVYGFRIMPAAEWERTKEELTDEDVRRFYFGSNEAIYYYSKAEFLEQFWSRPIKDADVKVLRKMFKGISSGFAHWPFKYLEFEVSEEDTGE